MHGRFLALAKNCLPRRFVELAIFKSSGGLFDVKGKIALSGTDGDFIVGPRVIFLDSSMGQITVKKTDKLDSIEIEFDNEKFNKKYEGGGEDWTTIDFQSADGQPLHVGKYADATRYPFNTGFGTVTTNGFDLSKGHRGCNTLKAEFNIRTLELDQAQQITKFAASFVQHCEGGEEYASGAILFSKKSGGAQIIMK